jgi:carboxyl-terminal processing protease
MKKHATVLLLLLQAAFSLPVYAQTDSGSARYIEAVRIAAAEAYMRQPEDVIRAAFDAVKPGYARRLPRYTAVTEEVAVQLDQAVALEAAARRTTSSYLVDDALRRILPKLDQWSGYMNPAEWRQYNASLKSSYSGVGMDLEKESDGSLTCWPYPFSRAEQSGISPGAKLIAVNGHPVEGMSVYGIGALVRGPRGTPVNLSVGSLGFMKKTVQIFRDQTQAATAFLSGYREGRQVIKIARFASSTPREIATLARSGVSLELDLRGCRGGDLDAAADCAGLFVGSKVVAFISRRTGQETLRSRGNGSLSGSVHIRQDGDTASAAEMFIQALIASRMASSSGSTTYGKATTQDIIPLKNGGALILTTGLIRPAMGDSWHGRGLPATD